MTAQNLPLNRLTRETFAPFGDVIETPGAQMRLINNGTTQRFHDLAKVETLGEQAHTLVSIFRGQPFALPLSIAMLERHPLGSQAFIPLQPCRWVVVVAPDENGAPGTPVAFLIEPEVSGARGVNYAANVWHHPLIALDAVSDFLVVDRGGDGNNLQEHFFATPYTIS